MTTDTMDISTSRRGRRGEVNWPTVLAAMGCSALVSAMVIVGGAFGILRYSSDLVTQSQAAQRTVAEITLKDERPVQTPGAGAPPAEGAGPPPAEDARGAPQAGGGAGDTGAARAPAAPPEGATVEPAAPAIPAAMDAAQLQGHLGTLLNPNTPAGDIATNLEGGEAGLPTVSAIAQALDFSKAIYSWNIKEGSVQVDGTNMHATLVTTLVGMGSREQQLTFFAADGRWKLSNASLCQLAANALAECTV